MVTQNNDIEVISIKITNQFNSANRVDISVTVPAGLQFDSYGFYTESNLPIPNVARASYNGSLNTGFIDSMLPNEVIVLKLSLRVTDILAAVSGNFTVTGTVVSQLTDPNLGDNTFTKLVAVTTCAPAAGPVSFTTCCCGKLSEKATSCSHGTTEWRYKANSKVNLDSITIDVSTGEYLFSQTNPTQNSSFVYEIWCIVGEDEYLCGEGTVTILKQFSTFPVGGGVGDESLYHWAEVVPGTTGNTLDLSTIYVVPCGTGSPSYSVEYDSDVYENVSVTGDILSYDVKATADPGAAEMIITRICL